ncbi:hypothetical protein [Methylobacterium sp. J-077]|uniref:hypothetical protein n=1 Tax=Methylobacterium sp. J-077 TaxID=2836656 RepID=UPI001FB9D8B3|nr:hypothetical protein [Methylobacterium sp. J-077]MCJ2126806.1 hypothetical protein [Methylobacterium sp. J-077]
MTWEPGHDPDRKARLEDLAEQIFTVMTGLPADPSNPRSESDIRRWSAKVAQSSPWPMPFHNGMTKAKRSVVKSEIESFKRAMEKAEQSLLAFHSPTFGKAIEIGTSVWDVRASMQNAIDFAKNMSNVSLADIPEKNQKSGKGSERHRAEAIASHCANYYYWITGENPSRNFREDIATISKFELFLENIFHILKVDASVDGVAKVVIRSFKATRTNWSRKQTKPSI